MVGWGEIQTESSIFAFGANKMVIIDKDVDGADSWKS